MEHLQSDLCSALELAVGDCYRLDRVGPPEFVVDGGGNTGLFTLAASARWPKARIVVCEPVPSNLEILSENLNLNGIRANIRPVCLGGAPGRTNFYCREANQGSFTPNLPHNAVIEVEVETLSEICSESDGQFVLVKLDIEGAELDVLGEFLKVGRRKTTIVGELHHPTDQKSQFCYLLQKSGWRTRFVKEDTTCSQFQACSADLAAELLDK
jgi:FkbM family methyltransferase